MQVNVVSGGDAAVAALLYRPPDQNLLNYLNSKMQQAIDYTSNMVTGYAENMRAMYDKFNSSQAIQAAKMFMYNLGMNTSEMVIQRFHNFEDFNPNRPQFAPKATPKIDDIRVLIIDEASMLPAGLVTYIRDVCLEKEIKIIFIGDTDQLPPVNQKKSIAFNICSKIYPLTEIVRQGATNPILGLLDMLRYDIENNTNRFLQYITTHVGVSNVNENGEGYTICSQSIFTEAVINRFTNPEYKKNIDMYRIIAYTNEIVQNWNKFVRNIIIS